jgi:hypothetical protein
MFVLSAFVILIDIGVTLVERRLLVWRLGVIDRRIGLTAFVTVTDLIVIRLLRAERA